SLEGGAGNDLKISGENDTRKKQQNTGNCKDPLSHLFSCANGGGRSGDLWPQASTGKQFLPCLQNSRARCPRFTRHRMRAGEECVPQRESRYANQSLSLLIFFCFSKELQGQKRYLLLRKTTLNGGYPDHLTRINKLKALTD